MIFLKIWKNAVLFYLGGMGYVGLELLWRRRSHSSMFVLGGICFLALGKLDEAARERPLPLRLAAGSQPQGQGALTRCFIQFAQRKKTDPAQDEHTAVAPPAPQQFQSHVTHAAQVKQDGVFPDFQKNHLEKIISKKLKIFLDKREMVSYNNEADFGGSEIPWIMAA